MTDVELTSADRRRLLRDDALFGAGLTMGLSLDPDMPGWVLGVALAVLGGLLVWTFARREGRQGVRDRRQLWDAVPLHQQVLASAGGAALVSSLMVAIGVIGLGEGAAYVGAATFGTALGRWLWRPAGPSVETAREGRSAERERRLAADLAEQHRRERDWDSTGR